MDMQSLRSEIARARRIAFRKGLLAGLLMCVGLLCICGCAKLDAYKSDLAFNPKTGQVDGSLKGAGPGGKYTENKGLNLSLGDNTATVVICGLVLLGVAAGVAAYKSVPAYTLRKRKENETP
jgi:hypothetical protein